MTRGVCFLILLTIAAVGPWWLLLAVGVGYCFVYGGIELLLIAFLVDAFFMPTHMLVPLYTIGTVCLLVVFEMSKPYLLFYS